MQKTSYKGIDYSLGQSNIDLKSGIRYGVINQNAVGQAWFDSSEPNYGEPTCPVCGSDAQDIESIDVEQADGLTPYFEQDCQDYFCEDCKLAFSSESAFAEDALSWYFQDNEYSAEVSDDYGDIFITESPYFTYAQFCSPCAPGAVHLENPLDIHDHRLTTNALFNNRGFCFGHDWFENEVAPYPVYSVETGKLVKP